MVEELNRLYELTQIEYSRKLTKEEELEYIKLVELLRENKIEIPFGIEI